MGRRRTTGLGCATALVAGALALGWAFAAPNAGAADAPLPSVSMVHVSDSAAGLHHQACENASSSYVSTGAVTVQRTGATDEALPVHYLVQASAPADVEPLTGEVTIPAGAGSAAIPVLIHFDPSAPPPMHIHRSSTVLLTVAGDAAYTVGTPSATVVLTYDVDTDPCPPRTAAPATSPPTTKPVVVRRAVATATPDPPAASATLPFTGGPLSEVLAGSGAALVGLGGAGMRYGRSRAARMRARRRKQAR